MDTAEVRRRIGAHTHERQETAAVLVPLVGAGDDLEILFEVRASTLAVQPLEVCLPGGAIEHGESALDAAVRETCEELLVPPEAIDLIGDLGSFSGPGGHAVHAFVARVSSYRGTFATAEVERTFTLPLSWLLEETPTVFEVALTPSFPDDFPHDRIPGGRAYPWRTRTDTVPFYLDTDPVIWGFTARVLMRLTTWLKANP